MSEALTSPVRVICKCGNSYTASMLTEKDPAPCPSCEFKNGFTWASLEEIDEMAFPDYRREVDAFGRKHLLIELGDFTCDEYLRSALEGGFSPLEYVKHRAEKLDLDFIDDRIPAWLR